jgi:hypothetical protein
MRTKLSASKRKLREIEREIEKEQQYLQISYPLQDPARMIAEKKFNSAIEYVKKHKVE